MGNFFEYAKTNIVPIIPLVFPLVILSQILIQLFSTIGRKTKIHAYKSGRIEIGFSQFGPSITLLGTLKAEKRNGFINNIKLDVSKKNSSWERSFEWRAFKPYTFSLIPQEENIKLEFVSAFLLTTDQSFKYNIIFLDDAFIDEHYDKIVSIQNLWQKYKNNNQLEEISEISEKHFCIFKESEEVVELLEKIEQIFYWEEGVYDIEMCIHTQRPSSKFITNYQTKINEEEIVKLKSNFINIIKFACGFNTNFKSIFLKYNE